MIRSTLLLVALALSLVTTNVVAQTPPPGPPGGGTVPLPSTVVPVLQPTRPVPIPGGVAAPGTVLPSDVVLKPQIGLPKIWVFANPTAVALGPTSAKLDWKARDGATRYRVWRNGVAIMEVAPKGEPSFSVVDAALAPGSLNRYKVWALQPQDPRAEVKDRSGLTLLEESGSTDVGTPAIVAPSNITASFVSANPNVVKLTWFPASAAVAYRMFRDDQVIQPSFGGTTFTDSGVIAGTHRYAVQSLYPAPGGVQITGAMSNPVKIRVGPFNAIAVGDSVMWGQGLTDSPGQSHKFTSRVRDWLQSSMGKPVSMMSFAHSGATLTPGSLSEETMVTPGEVPNSFPSITRQALTNAPAALSSAGVNPDDVDLVLVDGCINDIRIARILDPTKSDTEISGNTSSACAGMASLLTGIHGKFKNAKIVLTGYWAIVSPGSDLTAVASLVLATGAVVGPAAAGLVGIPLDPVTGLIAGAITSTALRDTLVGHSNTFLGASDTALLAAVGTASSTMGAGWISFVRPPFTADNAYAAHNTWLWLVPTDLFPKDEVYLQRTQTCGSIRFPSGVDAAECVEASSGHPNVLGAQAYADAITGALASTLPVWRQAHAATQHAP